MKNYLLLLGCLISFMLPTTSYGQNVTKIVGKVIDSRTKEPLPFVDVYFKGTYVGASTDLDGNYVLESKFPSDTVSATFIGYEEQAIKIEPGVRRQKIDFMLNETSVVAKEVTIVAKKKRYKRKNNPAVDLIKKVMENKADNRLEKNDYYTYDKHEKIQLDLNNITDQYKQRKIFNKFEFIWDYTDTSTVNGKVYLPLFLKESLSTVHYKKDGDTKKEYVEAINLTQFDEALDEKSINSVLELLYQDIDIYENDIMLMDRQFVSPLAPVGITFYRYYILDTLQVQNQEAIRLAFIPKNKQTIGFTGDLYISNDGKYSVLEADLGILGEINVNFVRDIKISQIFSKDSRDNFIKTTDKLVIDYALRDNGTGAYATRNVSYKNFNYDPIDDEKFSPIEEEIVAKDAYDKQNDYWSNNRIQQLSKEEENLYYMIDTLKSVPKFKKMVLAFKIFSTGYIPAGPVDIGPLATFVSGNDVEGTRLKFGIETSHDWNQKNRIQTYGAYGLRDSTYKYSLKYLHSFTDDYRENPKHYIETEYSKDVIFPGVRLEYLQGDNALLSIRRGRSDKMLLENTFTTVYYKDNPAHSYSLRLTRKRSEPHGNLVFNYTKDGAQQQLDHITIAEASFNFEFAPGKQIIQGRQYQVPIINNKPVINIGFKAGFSGVLGGEYSYQNVNIRLFKRFDIPLAGKIIFELQGGKFFGSDIPYTLLHIPRANQAYSYQRESFNLMNFMEFANDQYGRFRTVYFMDGYILNRIPLLKKLKLKEVFTCKVLYGSLTDKNNPNVNPELPQFSLNENGVPTTYEMNPGEPYIEASVGLYNIFKVLRIDLLKRYNYDDHPDIPELFNVKGLGIRGRFKVEF